MNKDQFLSNLLSRKLPDSSEIELHLFELCNLRCQFCGQDHEDKTGFDLILEKAGPVKEFIFKNNKTSHILNIMGGEIFNDELPDAIIKKYEELALDIDGFAKKNGHNCTFNWVTNLIFNKNDRVDNFLRRLDNWNIRSNISSSYDFTGRKNSLWSQDLFKKNLEHYKDRVFTIGFVLTKPAIKNLITKSDTFFDYLYKNYPLYFDYYVPESGANSLMPSDEELLDAYLFIANNYPSISPVKELLENNHNKMTCYSLNKLTLLPSGREVKCRYLNYESGQFAHEVDYSTNANIIEAHLEENECLSCQWFDRCGFRCFVQADWAKRKKSETCIFKSFFKEVL